MLVYPDVERIVWINKEVIEKSRQKKGDQHKLNKKGELLKLIHAAEQTRGNVYDKAATLMMELIRSHAFASGNKRTSFLSTKEFILRNGEEFGVLDEKDKNAATLIGIKEGYYSHDEVKIWLQTGKIREFRRS